MSELQRMSDEMFVAYETDDAAGMLLMDLESGKDEQIVELWGWMQAERAKVDELKVSLREIADQKLTVEMDEHHLLDADFEGGHDECVQTARAALEQGDG